MADFCDTDEHFRVL